MVSPKNIYACMLRCLWPLVVQGRLKRGVCHKQTDGDGDRYGFSMDLLRIVDVRFNYDGNIMFATFSSDLEISIFVGWIFDGLSTDVFPVSILDGY